MSAGKGIDGERRALGTYSVVLGSVVTVLYSSSGVPAESVIQAERFL